MAARRLLASRLVLLLSLLIVSPALGQDAPSAKLGADGPHSVAELRALEGQVEKVLAKVVPCTVGIRIGNGQGSGVIVSADGYVLTAGHVSGEPNRNAVVTLPSGKELKGKTLGRNTGIDSGLIKITEPGPYPFVEMSKAGPLAKGQWVVAVGHPGGFRRNRSPVVRLGRVLFANPFLIRTDCTLVGGDSGGPLFDLDGLVVGIHSRIGPGAITENIHVPVDTYRETWDRLASAESWGDQLGRQATVQSAGGKIVFEKKDKLTEDDFSDKGRGGQHYKVYTVPLKAGSTYTFDLFSKLKGGFDAFLVLQDDQGKKLAEDDDGGGDNNARIVYRALRDGAYKIYATTCDPGQVGNFRLTVREADFKDPVVTGRADVLKAIRLPRQLAGVVLDKLAASKIKMHLSAVVQNEAGKPRAGQEATLRWDQGEIALAADNDGVIRLLLTKERLKNLTFELPSATRAILAITDAKGNPVGPRFGGDNDPMRETVKSAGGAIVMELDGKLESTDVRDHEKKDSYHRIYELKLTPGAAYTFDLQSDDFDAFLRLEDAAGKKLAEDDDGAGNLNSRIVFRTNQEGAFRLVVLSMQAGQTGAYRLTVRRAEDAVK
jgi:serine protease Do